MAAISRLTFLMAVHVLLCGQALSQNGQALYYGGMTRIDVATTSLVATSPEKTVEAWVRTTPGSGVALISESVNAGMVFRVGVGPTGVVELTAQQSSGGTWRSWITGHGAVLPDLWSHVACVVSATGVTFHVNGIAVPSTFTHQAVAPPFQGTVVRSVLGACYTPWSNQTSCPGTGHVDELRLWSRALNGSEIAQGMCTQMSAGLDLVASWSFEGDLLDSAGANNGTPFGPVSWTSAVPLADITTLVSQPNGPNSVAVQNVNGTPGALYYSAVSVDPANAGVGLGTGWWYGLHIGFNDIVAQAGWGPPFFGVLDLAGRSSWSIPAGIPVNQPEMYCVTVEFDPLTQFQAGASLPIAFTLQ